MLVLLPISAQRVKSGLQDRIPVAKKKMVYEDRFEVALIVEDKQGRFRMRRCAPGEWWEGLWDFPRFEVKLGDWGGDGFPNLVCSSQRIGGESFTLDRKLFSLKHSVTKYRITLTCFYAKKTSRTEAAGATRWVTSEELKQLPLSASGRKVAERLLKMPANRPIAVDPFGLLF